MSFTYGVPQEQDWNALSDEAFRQIIRSEFETNYPQELRFLPHRPPFKMVSASGSCACRRRAGSRRSGRRNMAAWGWLGEKR